MKPDLELPVKSSRSNSHEKRLTVVYIAGVGRSGSTVLDSVLGNHSLIQSVGELSRLASDAWIENFYCSCGKRSQDCPFWAAVQRTWRASNGSVSAPELLEAQHKVEQFGRWPFILREHGSNAQVFKMYRDQTLLVLQAIQKTSGCSVIVDSSKAIGRAFALSLIPEIDLRIIQLVRDPRGVVWSHKKQFTRDLQQGLPRDIESRPAWRAALYWCRQNLKADELRRSLGPRRALLVRYEDFMLQTLPVLQRIGDFVGVDLTDVQSVISEGRKLCFDHTIAGNRVRMKRTLELSFDQEWREKLSPADRRVTEILCGWLMTRYGYSF